MRTGRYKRSKAEIALERLVAVLDDRIEYEDLDPDRQCIPSRNFTDGVLRARIEDAREVLNGYRV